MSKNLCLEELQSLVDLTKEYGHLYMELLRYSKVRTKDSLASPNIKPDTKLVKQQQ